MLALPPPPFSTMNSRRESPGGAVTKSGRDNPDATRTRVTPGGSVGAP